MGIAASEPVHWPKTRSWCDLGSLMTERLYYVDPTQREFTAVVVDRRDTERGPAVRLDRTAFYPTSGGQPNDTGKLDGIAVCDVWEEADDQVWHLLDERLGSERVRGEIDWERRFDHMQQHSGQHLLSAACVRLLQAQTIGFHLGIQESTIDLDVPALSWDDAFRAELEVNRVIWDDRPVQIRMVDAGDVAHLPLRKIPAVEGPLRVVSVPEYDAVACCGTHVSHTGQVGMVKVTRIERYKGGIRVGFVCGNRALESYQQALRSLQLASAALSVHPAELGPTVERLKDELRQGRRELKAAQSRLVDFEADQLRVETPVKAGERRIVAHLADHSLDQARALASRLAGYPRTVALLAVSDAGGVRVVCHRSDDLPEVSAAEVLRKALAELGGRGGGTAKHAQGGAAPHSSDHILQALRSAVGS